jgi:hypothetical protein
MIERVPQCASYSNASSYVQAYCAPLLRIDQTAAWAQVNNGEI